MSLDVIEGKTQRILVTFKSKTEPDILYLRKKFYWEGPGRHLKLVLTKDYVSGCAAFSFNCQSVPLLQAYLLLELFSSSLLAETGGKCPLVFSVTCVVWTWSGPKFDKMTHLLKA